MELKLTFPTTEFNSFPDEENEYTEFVITDKALSINAYNERNVMLLNTEIEISDAVKLANIILTLNK